MIASAPSFGKLGCASDRDPKKRGGRSTSQSGDAFRLPDPFVFGAGEPARNACSWPDGENEERPTLRKRQRREGKATPDLSEDQACATRQLSRTGQSVVDPGTQATTIANSYLVDLPFGAISR